MFTWAVRVLMACLVEGAAALPSSSGGSGRDPAVFNCFEQAMQVNILCKKKTKPKMQQPVNSTIEEPQEQETN